MRLPVKRKKKKLPPEKSGIQIHKAQEKPAIQIPQSLFSTGFDELATLWYKNPKAPEALRPEVLRRMAVEGLRAAEALIISPKVSFKVYGENVVLCRLIDFFGVKGVERLLEEGAIEFIFWNRDLVKMENPPDGLRPLAPITFTDPAHSDPEASVELGLKGWSNKSASVVERIAKLAVERTILPEESLPNTTIQAVYAAHAAGRLVADGFNPAIPLDKLTPQQRADLLNLGARAYEGALLLANSYDLHECSKIWDAWVKVFSTISRDDGPLKLVQEVMTLEGLPSIPSLILQRIISPQDIIDIRSSSATEELRKWLWSQPDPRDTKEIAAKYLAEISGGKVADRSWFKAARVTGVSVSGSALGAAAGMALAGTPGMIAGGALGLGVSLADTFGLEKLLRGHNPRNFAEKEIRPRVAAHLAKSRSTQK